MTRYRVRLGYPRGRVKSEVTEAHDCVVVDGHLKLRDEKLAAVAIYKPGYWTICRRVNS